MLDLEKSTRCFIEMRASIRDDLGQCCRSYRVECDPAEALAIREKFEIDGTVKTDVNTKIVSGYEVRGSIRANGKFVAQVRPLF